MRKEDKRRLSAGYLIVIVVVLFLLFGGCASQGPMAVEDILTDQEPKGMSCLTLENLPSCGPDAVHVVEYTSGLRGCIWKWSCGRIF